MKRYRRDYRGDLVPCPRGPLMKTREVYQNRLAYKQYVRNLETAFDRLDSENAELRTQVSQLRLTLGIRKEQFDRLRDKLVVASLRIVNLERILDI